MWTKLRMMGLVVPLILPSSASAAPPPAAHLTPAESRLLLHCAAYYAGDNVWDDRPLPSEYVAGDYQKYLRAFRQRRILVRDAKRALDRKPAATLRRELTPLFSLCRPGSPTYLSVAYVLAARGVDLQTNVDRILMADRLALSSLKPTVPYNAVDRRVSRTLLPMEAVGEGTGVALGRLYQKSHAPFILQRMLRMGCDAAACETLEETLAGLFAASPVELLRAASADEKAFRRLRDALAYSEEGNDRRKQVLSALRRVRAGGPNDVRATAGKLIVAIEKAPEPG